MNITENLIRISKAKDDIKQSLRDKGIPIPNDALLDEYSSIIDNVELYGPTYKNLYDMRTNNGTNMIGLYSRTTGELDLRQLDTSKVTDMKYMFDNSNANVNIDGWDTSKVTDMSNMFNFFSGSIDISKLDTSSITNVSNMFSQANTDNIILTGLSFPSTTKLSSMFNYAKGTTLDLSSWDISNITNMYNMFSNTEYRRIDLTGWKTTNVTNMESMFYTYSNPLEKLIIPDWDMTNTTSYSSFYYVGNSSNKNTLRLIDLSRSNDTTITKIASFLPTRTATTYGDVIVPFNTSQATLDTLIAKYWRPIGTSMTPVPTSAEIIAELDEIMPGKPRTTRVYVGNCDPWHADTSKVEIVMTSSESIATIEGDTITSTGITGDIVLEARIIDTQEVIGTKTIPVTETDSYPNIVKFRLASTPPSYAGVITVNGSGKQLSQLTYDSVFDIYSYDAGVPITSIDFSSYLSELVKLNTSNVTDMNQMFYGCNSLTSLNASNWDTSNVTNMREMFDACRSLTSLDVSNWDTSNVTNIDYMFNNCTSLISLDISNFDTSSVTSINGMFANCSKLHTLHLDNCSNDTINKIITSYNFPTNNIDGQVRTIYCREENAAGLTPPTNWVFSYID